MQLIREAKRGEGRGLIKNGGMNWVRWRAKAKLKSVQGEKKGMNQFAATLNLGAADY